jgi:hypothetical protein
MFHPLVKVGTDNLHTRDFGRITVLECKHCHVIDIKQIENILLAENANWRTQTRAKLKLSLDPNFLSFVYKYNNSAQLLLTF